MITNNSLDNCAVSAPTMCNTYRSLVPDLLFEDVQNERILEIQPYLEEPELVNASVPLHRLTIFLTYACNLDCPYCKTIARTAEELRLFPQKAHQFTLETFERLLQSQEDAPIRHLHFTGGEATLVRDLPRMVRLAKETGLEHVSITSNGTMPARCYEALIDSGMDEIRISVDAREAGMGALLTGRRHAWSASVDNLRLLSTMRARRSDFFLIANTVISSLNRRETLEIVRFLMALNVQDIKLIMVVQEKGSLGDFSEAEVILQEIERVLRDYPSHAFPLLRRKIRTIFDSEAIGLTDVPSAQRADWRCYIPLTERTVDSDNYYPCSVYLREGGMPLGRLDDPAPVQREKTARFVREGKCLDDSICQQYCLHCTKNYNIAANAARQK